MAIDPLDPCTWEDVGCRFTCGIAYPVSDGPDSRNHTIKTNYTLTLFGHIIPIVKTTRDFSVSYGKSYSPPISTPDVAWNTITGELAVKSCTQTGDERKVTPTCNISDVCSIEKSTLHYLDMRYGVCLYRYVKEELNLNKVSNENAMLKTTSGYVWPNQVQIKTADYTSTQTVEWRLLIDGVMTVVATSSMVLEPFGPERGKAPCTGLYSTGFEMDSTTRKILLFPQPESLAIPVSLEIDCMGFYDYGNLPGEESDLAKADGGKDMFYPEWCRYLQEDPFWKAAAESRYNMFWFHAVPVETTAYTPPAITVDPIPIGSFARHPEIGDLYQFLCDSTIVESEFIKKLVYDQLPEKMRKDIDTSKMTQAEIDKINIDRIRASKVQSQPMLYYPISL